MCIIYEISNQKRFTNFSPTVDEYPYLFLNFVHLHSGNHYSHPKEAFKCSLRYSESLAKKFFNQRIPKSTLNYWEMKHSNLIKEVECSERVFKSNERLYTVIDSTKFSNWNLSELFVCIRVRKALIPVYTDLMGSKEVFLNFWTRPKTKIKKRITSSCSRRIPFQFSFQAIRL